MHKNILSLLLLWKIDFGHDFRYAIDTSKIKNKLGWIPKEDFQSGIRKNNRLVFKKFSMD